MSVKVIACFTLLYMLCGYFRVMGQSYIYIVDGAYVCGDTAQEDGVARSRAATDIRALQYVTDGRGIPLSLGEFIYYIDALYSFSDYRELLLENGYRIESEVKTSDVLNTTLPSGSDGVRLIYRPGGSIRTLSENLGDTVHILLEGVQQ